MSLISFIKRVFQWFIPPKKPISNSCTLREFMKHYERMQVHVFTDSFGNQTIDRCVFTDYAGKEIEVYIAKVLQNYSKEDLKREKDKLFIKVFDSGNLCLCKKREDVEMEGWEV